MKNLGVLVVDVQGDFTEVKNGSLAVNETGQAYIDAVEAMTRTLKDNGFKVFATQDWHPEDHISFFTNTPGKNPLDSIEVDGRNQILWPPHCVQGTDKANILLDETLFTAIIRKGTHPNYDSYSGFQDDGGMDTDLHKILKSHAINHLIIYGLATDYCVKATVLDALANGYDVVLVENLCKGVTPETTLDAIKEMKNKGAAVTDQLKVESLEQWFDTN